MPSVSRRRLSQSSGYGATSRCMGPLRCIALGLCLSLLWGSSANAESTAHESTWAGRLYHEVRTSIVLIRSGDSEGTGFCYLSPRHIATAFHVVRGGDPIVVVLADGSEIPARIAAWDDAWDLAILELPVSLNVSPLRVVGPGESEVGAPVAAVGNPWGAEQRKQRDDPAPVWALSKGVISAPPSDLIQTDAPVNPGNSGGPLLTTDGRVVGVLVVRVAGSDGISFAVGSQHLIALTTRLGQQEPYSPRRWRLDAELHWVPLAEHSLSGVSMGGRWVYDRRFAVALRGARLWGATESRDVLRQQQRNRWLLEGEVTYRLLVGDLFALPLGVGTALHWDRVQEEQALLDAGQLHVVQRVNRQRGLRLLLSAGLESSVLSVQAGMYLFDGPVGARLLVGLVL